MTILDATYIDLPYCEACNCYHIEGACEELEVLQPKKSNHAEGGVVGSSDIPEES